MRVKPAGVACVVLWERVCVAAVARCWVLRARKCSLEVDRTQEASGDREDLGDGSLFENCIVDASICGQVFKGARWMPWHQEPMKDVGGHDSPRGVVNQALIRGFPNGETRQSSWAVTRC